ncbi:MAG: Rho termination factor N-terminal domain-containing protein [Candidatus Dehalobacter alkaniphilus]
MIKIIAGTFGYFDGRKVVPKTSADAPIELDAALEKRLVDKGVAAYVTKKAEQPPEGDGLPAYNKDMKLAELQEIAKAYGVDASKMKAKAEVVAAIDAAKEAKAEDPDDGDGETDGTDPENGSGELPPALGASDPV